MIASGALHQAAPAVPRGCRSGRTERADSAHAGKTPDVETAVRATRYGGSPLPEGMRSYFEPRFGHDFSDVRIHTDSESAAAAGAVRARAYTLGSDIVFGSGQYAPHTGEGTRLLAHELAHVTQRNPGVIQRTPAGTAGGRPAPEPTERPAGTLWAKGPDGKDLPPSLDDLAQGGLDDCFLFAAMGAIVHTDPQRIVNMIKDNGNGTYTVTFKGIGFWSAAKQTVSADFIVHKHGHVTARKALWPLVIEKAYAQQKGGLGAFDKGGNAGDAVDDMLDDSASRFDPREKSASYILGKLARAKEKKWPATILAPKKDGASQKKKAMADSIKGLYFWHAYVVVDIDAVKNRIKLFNPWGSDHPNGDGWIDVEQARTFFIEVDIND